MRKRFRGEDGYQAKMAYINTVVNEHSTLYEGSVLLVPSAKQLAEMVPESVAFFYCMPNESYEEKVEKATGLSVIHKGRLVLAKTVEINHAGTNR